MTNRTILLASTLIAGFACSAFDAAQAARRHPMNWNATPPRLAPGAKPMLRLVRPNNPAYIDRSRPGPRNLVVNWQRGGPNKKGVPSFGGNAGRPSGGWFEARFKGGTGGPTGIGKAAPVTGIGVSANPRNGVVGYGPSAPFANGGAPFVPPGKGRDQRNGPTGVGNAAANGVGGATSNGLGNVGNGPRGVIVNSGNAIPLPGKSVGDGKGVGAGSAAGSDVSTALNPKSASGGKGPEDVGSRPDIPIPAALADIYRLTGGNLDALRQFAEFADWIKNRPDLVPDPLSPNKGDGSFWPEGFPQPGSSDGNKRGNLDLIGGWGPGGAPRPAGFNDPRGKVGQDDGDFTLHSDGTSERTTPNNQYGGWTHQLLQPRTEGGSVRTTTITDKSGRLVSQTTRQTETYTEPNDEGGTDQVTIISSRTVDGTGNVLQAKTVLFVETLQGSSETSGDPEKGSNKPQKEKDSQPAPEGYGRPSGGPNCGIEEDPRNIRGPGDLGIQCAAPNRSTTGAARVLLREADGSGTIGVRRQSPGWATDPNDGGSDGGSGRSGGGGPPPVRCDSPDGCERPHGN